MILVVYYIAQVGVVPGAIVDAKASIERIGEVMQGLDIVAMAFGVGTALATFVANPAVVRFCCTDRF